MPSLLVKFVQPGLVPPISRCGPSRFPRWLLVCSVTLLAFLPHPLRAATTLRVGTYENAPLIFRTAEGVHRGVYIDLLQHVAEQEGWRLEYVDGSWEEGLRRLQRGSIDLLVAIGYSEERSRLFDFTREAVVVNWGQVYVRPGSAIQSPLDLSGKKLAVIRGDVYYDNLKSVQPILKIFPKFIEVRGYDEALPLLAEGNVEAALVPRIFGAYHERAFDIQRSTIMFSPTELRFAAPKGKRREVLAALDRSLTALKADKRSVYYRALNVWIEGVQTLVFPKWLNPLWVIGVVGSTGLVIVGMNLLLRRQVRLRTEALRESLAAQARTASELRIARDIQMSFVPTRYPAIPGYELHGILQPARAVGGDFYDCFSLDEEHLYLILGDVSGKGVPAALFMAVSTTLLSATALAAHAPGPILARVNERVSRNNDACMFVTVFCGILHVPSGGLAYTNAGHNPPALLRRAGEVEFLEAGRCPALGIVEGAQYEVCDAKLAPGDSLVMYTDGVTEAMNGRQEMFSEDRLRAELSAASGASAQGLVGTILQKVMAFAGDAPQADDIAVLVLRRQPDQEAVLWPSTSA